MNRSESPRNCEVTNKINVVKRGFFPYIIERKSPANRCKGVNEFIEEKTHIIRQNCFELGFPIVSYPSGASRNFFANTSSQKNNSTQLIVNNFSSGRRHKSEIPVSATEFFVKVRYWCCPLVLLHALEFVQSCYCFHCQHFFVLVLLYPFQHFLWDSKFVDS